MIAAKEDEKTPIVSDGCCVNASTHRQALAPYRLAGCCAVNGLVPRALFIGNDIIALEISCVNRKLAAIKY